MMDSRLKYWKAAKTAELTFFFECPVYHGVSDLLYGSLECIYYIAYFAHAKA